MPKSYLKTESPDILKNVSATQNVELEQDLPPKGSALNIETALTYARRAQVSVKDGDYALTLDRLNVVVEQLEEVAAKIKRQRQLNAP